MSNCQAITPAPPIYDNSLYRRKIIRPLARRVLAPLLFHLGFSGNGVCWLKLIFGLAGAILLGFKSASVGLGGMLLLQVNFLLDAADGEVARLRGEAAQLSGEYIDKLFDHIPKVSMYFFWGYGVFQLTGSQLGLFCGLILAVWNIYPRFCAVETLLERLDKAPDIYQKPEFHRAVASCFVTSRERGGTDYWLTVFLHPAMNLLTVFFLIEIFLPQVPIFGQEVSTRWIFLGLYTFISLVNLLRKCVRYFRELYF